MGLFIYTFEKKKPGAIYKFLGAVDWGQVSEIFVRNPVEVWLDLVDLLAWPPDGWPKCVSGILRWNGSKTLVRNEIHTRSLAQKCKQTPVSRCLEPLCF